MNRCARCGALGETKQVTVLRSIGLLIAVNYRSIGGSWCRPCIDAELGPATLITAALGWWSIIGVFLTPVFLALNFATFLRTRGMQLPTSAPLSLGPATAAPPPGPRYGAPPQFGAPSSGFGAPSSGAPSSGATSSGFGASSSGTPSSGFGAPQATDAPRPIAATIAMTTPLAPSGFAPTAAPQGFAPSAPQGNGLAIGIGLGGAAVAGIGVLFVAFFGYLWAYGTNEGDQRFSPLCLGISFLACVLPGLAGLGYGLFRVMRKA